MPGFFFAERIVGIVFLFETFVVSAINIRSVFVIIEMYVSAAKAQHKLKDFLGNDDFLFGVIGELGGFGGMINCADFPYLIRSQC